MSDQPEVLVSPTVEALLPPLRALQREIGAAWWPKGTAEAILSEWTRQLARVVGDHVMPGVEDYAEEINGWALCIARERDGWQMVALCEDIHKQILERDNFDGWPTDRGMNALNAVCLGAMYGLDPERAENSRWPAQASQVVWEFVTGARNGNEVVTISRSAWQRHVFTQAVALAGRWPGNP